MSMQKIEGMLDDIKNNFMKRLEAVESQLRTRKWANLPGAEDSGFSFFRAFRAIKTGDWSEAGVEREIFDQAKKRALGTSDDAAGGYLVPVQAMGELIEMLYAKSVVIESGAQVIPDLKGSPVQFPKMTGGATVYWIGDNSEIPDSEQTFGQIQMTPKKAAALVKLSNSLLAQSNPGAEAVVRQDIARGLSLAVDLAALRGTGSENQPLGIANTAGINTVTLGSGNGAVLGNNLDLFEDMAYELDADNALQGRLGFVFHPTVRRTLRKMKTPQWSGDSGGAPLIPQVILAAMAGDRAIQDAIGYPFRTSTQIPTNLVTGGSTNCTEVFFANWADVLIGMWGGMTILASNVAGTSFAYDQTWIRIIMNVDVVLRHPESVCLCNSLKIA
jgi:HK97 family phage major capsid protein